MNEEDEYSVFSSSHHNPLRVVITEGTTEVAFALMYRIFSDNIFGCDQLILLCIYETKSKAVFLASSVIELIEVFPNLLDGEGCSGIDVIYTSDPSVAFKDADVVFCVGKARGYEFSIEEYTDTFFEESVSLAKFHGESIEKYAKRSVKVIVLGHMEANIISHYAKSIARENITAVSLLNMKICIAYIANQVGCRSDEIKNIILWGGNNKHAFPDCRYMSVKNKRVTKNNLKVWLKINLPQIIQNKKERSRRTRSLAYALAEHCKILWNGTPEGEWTCMAVYSDMSYGVYPGLFFSFPVFCKNGEYEIVQDLLKDDPYVEKHIRTLTELLLVEVRAAFKICGIDKVVL